MQAIRDPRAEATGSGPERHCFTEVRLVASTRVVCFTIAIAAGKNDDAAASAARRWSSRTRNPALETARSRSATSNGSPST